MADEKDTGKPEAEVTKKEEAALDGAAGPNRTPAFGKRDFEDENVQFTDSDDLKSVKEGSAASSGNKNLDIAGLVAAASVGEEREGAEDETVFTSHPISKLRVGRFQFQNGVLRLKGEDVEAFEKLLGASALRTQQVIRRVDRSSGEVVARRYLEQNKSRSTRDVDTSDRGPLAANPHKTQG
jgi:hypothetical protein